MGRTPNPPEPGAAALSGPLKAVIGAAVLVGSAALAGALALHGGAWSATDLLIGALAAIAVALAERFPVPRRHGPETENFTLSAAVWAATLLIARPGILTVAVAAGVLAGQALHRWPAHKVAFNVGQHVAAVAAAELLFGALRPDGPLGVASWPAAGAAVLLAAVLNTAAVALVISVATHSPFLPLLVGPRGLNAVHALTDLEIGMVGSMAIAFPQATPPLVVAVAAMAWLARRAEVATLGADGPGRAGRSPGPEGVLKGGGGPADATHMAGPPDG